MACIVEQFKSQECGQHRVFAFVFPLASGHINPSFPVARALVAAGHEVHYLVREQMREPVEDAGAIFHDELVVLHELYGSREPEVHGALEALSHEYGVEKECFMDRNAMLRALELEMQLPGTIRWLRDIGADAVTYDPLLSPMAAIGAFVVGIPSVALLSFAGPGAMTQVFAEIIANNYTSAERMAELAESYQPNLDAVARMNEDFGLDLTPAGTFFFKPLGKLGVLKYSKVCLVTTCEDFQDPMTDEVAAEYRDEGVQFAPIGPLLDVAGAKRALGHKADKPGSEQQHAASHDEDDARVVAQVRAAKSAGRQVVLVSMGTFLTGDCPDLGWDSRKMGEDGRLRGLTGCQLCRGVWGAAFDAFGSGHAEEGPFLVVAVGPQPDPLGDLSAPANSVCLPSLPQVDILKAGVDLFLTHGGQNSFTEGLSVGSPLVVCPGFGDQPTNARKAERLGVGLGIMRPDPDQGAELEAAAQYRSEIAAALRSVLSERHFTDAAARCAWRLQSAGGVPAAVKWMLIAASGSDEPCSKSEGCDCSTADSSDQCDQLERADFFQSQGSC